jgi:NitT/TauT family transport system substrate-binding protein
MAPRSGRSARSFAPLRAIVGGLSALTLLASVSGCGLLGGTSETAAPPAESGNGQVEKSKITLGVIPVIDTAPVYIAQKKGYFQEEGLEVDVKKIQGGAAAIPGLKNGDLDFSFGNFVSFFAAQSKGALSDADGLKIVSDGYQAKPEMFLILAKGDSAIKSAKDLAGKTIAVNTFANIAELTARATLETNGVDPATVTFKEFAFPDMQAAVKNGQVDAAFMVEPFITKASREEGQVTVLDAASGPTDGIPIAGYAATGKFAAANPKTVAAFQRAMAKGQKDASDRPTVEPLLVEYAGVDKETASLVHFGDYPTSLDATRLQRVADLMKTYGALENELDVKPMLVVPSGS